MTITGENIIRFNEIDYIDTISFNLSSVTVRTSTRRINNRWTPQLTQDVSIFHNIDVEAELTALLSEEMAREIDREIINTIFGEENFNYRIYTDTPILDYMEENYKPIHSNKKIKTPTRGITFS